MTGLVIFCRQDAAKCVHVGYIHEDSLRAKTTGQSLLWTVLNFSLGKKKKQFPVSLTDLVAYVVAESHVRVQGAEQLVVFQLSTEEAAFHQVHIGHIWHIPDAPKNNR